MNEPWCEDVRTKYAVGSERTVRIKRGLKCALFTRKRESVPNRGVVTVGG